MGASHGLNLADHFPGRGEARLGALCLPELDIELPPRIFNARKSRHHQPARFATTHASLRSDEPCVIVSDAGAAGHHWHWFIALSSCEIVRD
jgi:hypothetical protein